MRKVIVTALVGAQAVVPVGYGVAWMYYAQAGNASAPQGLLHGSLLEVLSFYPVVFLGVGLAVLALRPRDPHAWLMAMLFSSFLAMSSVLAVPFAYAGVKHRVLDIPLLLKRSARYLLVRRGLGVLLFALATLLTAIFTTVLGPISTVSAGAAPLIGVVVGVALALGSLRLLRQATRRIDRVFFRGAYNAAEILS